MARSETYEEFTAKFEPKKTTDDCYTPPEVYGCVLDWAHREYGFDLAKVARPFYPGGDYEREEYPEGCTVVDNPPFSILSRIVKHYQERGVGFFLFAPTLTCMGIRNCCKVVTGAGVTYANGASVNTSFVTNLDPAQARSAPDLRAELDAAIERLRREKTKALPKYEYPDEVLTAPMLARYSKYGIDFRVGPQECSFTRALDAQRGQGKAIYGSGYLISERAAAERAAAERAAAERAAAERFALSPRERDVIASLG